MNNILIIGCNGFIGNAIVTKFYDSGFKVYGCDLINFNNSKIEVFYDNSVFENNPNEIFNIDFQVCVNCAGSASVPYSFDNPFKDYELNTRIVFRILDEIRKTGNKTRFLNLSSAAVYGNPIELPILETSNRIPISPYGNHKLMSETIVNQFRYFFSIDATSLRIFSAFGPGLKKQLFWDIYQKILISKQIQLFGSGLESRDFIYIDDLCEVIFLIATTKDNLLPVYNVANGEEIQIRKAIEIFCRNFSSEISVEFTGSERTGDPSNWKADISRIRKLGYKPNFSIEMGIVKTIEWLKNQK